MILIMIRFNNSKFYDHSIYYILFSVAIKANFLSNLRHVNELLDAEQQYYLLM